MPGIVMAIVLGIVVLWWQGRTLWHCYGIVLLFNGGKIKFAQRSLRIYKMEIGLDKI